MRAIWTVCAKTGAPVEAVIRRMEAILGAPDTQKHRNARWPASADDLIRETFLPALEEIGRSPIGAARRAKALLKEARAQACPSGESTGEEAA